MKNITRNIFWLFVLLTFSNCHISGQEHLKAVYSTREMISSGTYKLKDQNIITRDLKEVSGLVVGRTNSDLVYMIEDKGGRNEVYVFDKKGNYKTTLIITGVANIDWEDLAIGLDKKTGKNYVYIADIGDNDAKRDYVRIIRFEEPKLEGQIKSSYIIRDTEILKVRYPGGAKDAETLMFDPFSEVLYIVSKREEVAMVYEVSFHTNPSEVLAKRVAELPFKKLVGGDISSEGNKIVLKDKKNVYVWDNSGKNIIQTLVTNPPLKLSNYVVEPQGESIGFDSVSNDFFTITETKKIPNALPILYVYTLEK